MTFDRLVDPDEVRRLAARFGEPRRVAVALDVGASFYEAWVGRVPPRRGEVMFVMPRPHGILLHAKSYYPANTWRLLTGGVEIGEAVIAALEREPREETGLAPAPETFLALIEYEFRWKGESVPWVTYAFRMETTSAPLAPSHDGELAATREAPPAELVAVAKALETLPPPWSDWGRYRAIAHHVVASALGVG